MLLIHIFWDVPGQPDPEDEGNTVLQNPGNYLSKHIITSQEMWILTAHMDYIHSLPGVEASVWSSVLKSSSPSWTLLVALGSDTGSSASAMAAGVDTTCSKISSAGLPSWLPRLGYILTPSRISWSRQQIAWEAQGPPHDALCWSFHTASLTKCSNWSCVISSPSVIAGLVDTTMRATTLHASRNMSMLQVKSICSISAIKPFAIGKQCPCGRHTFRSRSISFSSLSLTGVLKGLGTGKPCLLSSDGPSFRRIWRMSLKCCNSRNHNNFSCLQYLMFIHKQTGNHMALFYLLSPSAPILPWMVLITQVGYVNSQLAVWSDSR